ncbi:MAG TPA: hypothetical protein VES97_04125 [Solirubrobacteraceae bacterium]|nr:hypothetical protein [Solirubrobacteraceae bacterium]
MCDRKEVLEAYTLPQGDRLCVHNVEILGRHTIAKQHDHMCIVVAMGAPVDAVRHHS